MYWPSPAEREDPKLYAANVRQYMVGQRQRPFERCFAQVGLGPDITAPPPARLLQLDFSGAKDTTATYEDKLRLMRLLRPEDAASRMKKAA